MKRATGNAVTRQAGWFCLLATLMALPGARADDADTVSGQLANACLVCHGDSASMQGRAAPPITAIKDHYLTAFPERSDFVRAVSEWARRPSAERTHMPGAIRRFGLMPAVELDVETLEAIAELIHDTDLSSPAWYEEHRRAEHGPRAGSARGDRRSED